ncbi:MAG: PorP/SprF family type IX secretion system membrane protein [Microscillaceae bacterium]|nr:PorP/SprF family type IX secretion system membrane protein [Microscillaceae bacterium]
MRYFLSFLCGLGIKRFSWFLFWGLSYPLCGQDAHFSQFYAAPLSLNPALAGLSPDARFAFNFRSQWPKLPGEFVSYQLAYDQGFTEARNGLGLLLQLDRAGSAGVRSLNAQVMYAYTLAFEQFAVRAGLSLGYGNRNLDYFQLVFGDQLTNLGLNGQPTLENGLENINVNYWEVGTGLLFYTENFWFGVAGHHLNQPNQSLGNDNDPLPRKISVQAGYKFIRYRPGRNRRDGYDFALMPAVYYSQQGDFRQLDLGANVFLSPVIFGLWYRGVPVSQSYNGALVAMSGFKYQGFRFLYSYDLPMGRFASATGGAHEISLALQLGEWEKKTPLSPPLQSACLPRLG